MWGRASARQTRPYGATILRYRACNNWYTPYAPSPTATAANTQRPLGRCDNQRSASTMSVSAAAEALRVGAVSSRTPKPTNTHARAAMPKRLTVITQPPASRAAVPALSRESSFPRQALANCWIAYAIKPTPTSGTSHCAVDELIH